MPGRIRALVPLISFRNRRESPHGSPDFPRPVHGAHFIAPLHQVFVYTIRLDDGFRMPDDIPAQRDHPPYFRHVTASVPRRTLSPTTRIAAAATYLDDSFADAVIDELIANEHRAVVPSFFGLDLDAIIRHALNAKRLSVYRDVVLTLILVAGLLVSLDATVCWLVVGVYVTVVASMWPALTPLPRLGAVLIGVAVAVILLLIFVVGSHVGQQSSYDGSSFDGGAVPSAGISTAHLVVDILLYPIAAMVALTGFFWHRYRLLAEGFQHGATSTPPEIRDPRIRERAETVARAQYGNVTMYTGWSPFLGAGKIVRSWSIAVDLVRVDDITGTRTAVSIDPVDLHGAIMERVNGLHDADQPENERVAGLALGHHVVALGTRRRDHALIGRHGRPFEFAEPETIKAIIRYPQGGVRYYQRVSITADGKPVLDPRGAEIAEVEDQEIAATAFIYVAVEGGMLYVEFVGTVMPPIRERYHAIDALPRHLRAEWLPRVLRYAAASFFTGAVLAPLRVLPGLFASALLRRRMNRAARDADEFLTYDYGARISVRERMAAPGYATYLQQLDAQKYSKFIERRMNEAVLDYLTAADVDASEYRERVRVVQNSGVIITGGEVSGQIINASTAGSVAQHQAARPTTSTPEAKAS
jgi:hypothetical protein